MNATDFKQGDRVLYVPHHAHGNTQHPDCERGIVSSTNDTFVFVLYYAKRGEPTLLTRGQATSPGDLIKEDA